MARVFNSASRMEPGEKEVLQLFEAKLDDRWEIYVQPYLNGLRPDFVLINPDVGIGVFEVKDWTLTPDRYRVSGKRLKLIEGGGRELELENPLDQVTLYREEVYQLYCPALEEGTGIAAITAGVIFTRATITAVRAMLEQIERRHADREPGQYRPVSAQEAVADRDMKSIFPECSRRQSSLMSESHAADLRLWLRTPFESRDARAPLILDANQRRLATNRTESGHRRIRGPAGAGKSLVAAARAVEIARTNRQVLVASYNITLFRYLHALAKRYEPKLHELDKPPQFLHFHAWCKRVCYSAGRGEDYEAIWDGTTDSERAVILQETLPRLVLDCYRGSARAPTYDAVIVDEGQDFTPLWWSVLEAAVPSSRQRGEMVLIVDKTQNIYRTAAAWTDVRMSGTGFRGPWRRLNGSYRLAPRVAELASSFARRYMVDEELDLPDDLSQTWTDELPLDAPTTCRWFQVAAGLPLARVASGLAHRLMNDLPADMAASDVCYLTQSSVVGREIARHLEASGIRVSHTFRVDDKGRAAKMRFRTDVGRVKGTTAHSFKGWESRALLVVIDDLGKPEAPAVLYAAFTRLRRHMNGSVIWVVCSVPALQDYGRTWDHFERVNAMRDVVPQGLDTRQE
jgi:hypothetical protein